MATPSVSFVTPRLEFSGLLSSGETTTSFLAQGVDPAMEKRLGTFVLMGEGDYLSAGDRYGAILGRGLAASINVKVGDTVTLLTNTRAGSINAIQVKVRGIFTLSTRNTTTAPSRSLSRRPRNCSSTTASRAWSSCSSGPMTRKQ